MHQQVTEPDEPTGFEGARQAPIDAESWPLERLEREIGELAAHIHAGTSRWLALVAEFDRREGWADWGCKSCAHWISHTCALGPLAAREHVRVARRLSELPRIRAAFDTGELSYSQVRALSRVATPELEPTLLEIARHATAAQLERTLRAYRGVVARELSPADLAHGERTRIAALRRNRKRRPRPKVEVFPRERRRRPRSTRRASALPPPMRARWC
jgi:Domain of unknown function (DUF222)